MARTTDERKAWSILSNHLKAIDWNPAAFAVIVQYAHPAIQKRMMETFLHCVDVWAEEFIKGCYTGETRYVSETSYEIRNLIRTLFDESFPPKM